MKAMKRYCRFRVKYRRHDGVIDWASQRFFDLEGAEQFAKTMPLTQKPIIICVGYV